MPEERGYLFVFREPFHAGTIEERIDAGESFTDVISVRDWQPKPTGLGLISTDGSTMKCAALVQRERGRVATGKARIRFSDFVDLDAIAFADVEQHIGPRFKPHISRLAARTGGRVSPKTWQHTLECIARLRPSVMPEINRLRKMAEIQHTPYVGQPFEIIAQEKDALGLALDVFGLDRRQVLRAWTHPEHDEPAPFIRSLNQQMLREDQILVHDSSFFADWEPMRQYTVGAVEFVRDNEKLTVLNANRTRIEETLGVDLVYYHHRYKSYVLVQYKRMTNGDYQPVGFRPTGRAYENELQRMREFGAAHPDDSTVALVEEYRMHPGPFYFKLCRPDRFEPLATRLLPGMYMPLDYWERLTQSPQVRGPRGGIKVTYDNVGRYLNNTLFVQLFQDGWIGSRGEVTEAIALAIEGVEAGHSVILGISEGLAR